MPRYIDADALIELWKGCTFKGDITPIIANAPTADVQPVVHGHWEHDSIGANYCSECGMYPYDDGEYHMVWHADFCPNCGADMRGENE